MKIETIKRAVRKDATEMGHDMTRFHKCPVHDDETVYISECRKCRDAGRYTYITIIDDGDSIEAFGNATESYCVRGSQVKRGHVKYALHQSKNVLRVLEMVHEDDRDELVESAIFALEEAQEWMKMVTGG